MFKLQVFSHISSSFAGHKPQKHMEKLVKNGHEHFQQKSSHRHAAFDLQITLSAPGVDAQPQIVEKPGAQPHRGGQRSRRQRQEYRTHAAAQPGLRWLSDHLNNGRRQSAEMAALWPLGVQRPAPRHMRKSTSPRNDTLDGPGRPRRMTPRLLRGPTGSAGARHRPWATKRRARPRNGGATAARRTGGACIAPRATPIPTGRTARGKKCAPCPCPRRPRCLAGLRVSRPGSAPFASTPPPPLPILGPKMASPGFRKNQTRMA